MKFPPMYRVASMLYDESHQWSAKDWGSFIDEEGEQRIDVWLRVMSDGAWDLLTGDSQYDQDHCGYWGSSCIGPNLTQAESEEIAKDLIDQCRDHAAQCDETVSR